MCWSLLRVLHNNFDKQMKDRHTVKAMAIAEIAGIIVSVTQLKSGLSRKRLIIQQEQWSYLKMCFSLLRSAT